MENKNELSWFAVHVHSRHEFQVSQRITGTGIEAFLPSVERLRRWKDRNKLLQFPLFPGYLFVHTDRSHHARLAILKTKGVVGILGTVPGEPEPVPDDHILSLKKLVDNKAALDPYPYLEEGQRARIKSGPFAGVEGILIQKSERHTLVLSVDILRQSAAVTIDASEVEAV
jgi:transcription termination/antitermination protein NusG